MEAATSGVVAAAGLPVDGSESAILLGPTIEYQISEVADRNVGIVAKVKKSRIPPASVTPSRTPRSTGSLAATARP